MGKVSSPCPHPHPKAQAQLAELGCSLSSKPAQWFICNSQLGMIVIQEAAETGMAFQLRTCPLTARKEKCLLGGEGCLLTLD